MFRCLKLKTVVLPTLVVTSFISLTGCGANSTESTNVNPTVTNTSTTSASSPKTQSSKTQSMQTKPKSTDATSIVNALKATGLPISKMVAYTASDDPNKMLGRPGQYTSKVNFVITTAKNPPQPNDIEVSNGGSIEVFSNADDAKTRYEYIAKLAKSVPMLNEYDFRDGNVVMRISNDLTPIQEKKYEKALTTILG